MTADVVDMNRAARRRAERAAGRSAPAKAPAAPEKWLAPMLHDVQTVLLGGAGWSAGHAPFPPGPARDEFRGACDRLAEFLDMELGWPADPAPPPKSSRLILPGS